MHCARLCQDLCPGFPARAPPPCTSVTRHAVPTRTRQPRRLHFPIPTHRLRLLQHERIAQDDAVAASTNDAAAATSRPRSSGVVEPLPLVPVRDDLAVVQLNRVGDWVGGWLGERCERGSGPVPGCLGCWSGSWLACRLGVRLPGRWGGSAHVAPGWRPYRREASCRTTWNARSPHPA
jgi:hypothetical protein